MTRDEERGGAAEREKEDRAGAVCAWVVNKLLLPPRAPPVLIIIIIDRVVLDVTPSSLAASGPRSLPSLQTRDWAAAKFGYTDEFGNRVEEEEESDDEYGYEDSDEFSDDE